VAVFGNHDLEAGAGKQVCAELAKANVHLLDGDHFVFEKTLGVAGSRASAAASAGPPCRRSASGRSRPSSRRE
jgi:hypothetical protein